MSSFFAVRQVTSKDWNPGRSVSGIQPQSSCQEWLGGWFRGLRLLCLICLAAAAGLSHVTSLKGQSHHFGAPLNSVGSGFNQSAGIHWNAGIPGWNAGGTRVMGLSPQGPQGSRGALTPNLNFSFHGGNLVPPFGYFNPGAGGRLDVRGRNFQLGLTLAKGSSTSLSMQAPSLMVPNGSGGSMFSGQIRPFVTGVVPVLGCYSGGYPDNAVTRAVASGMLDRSPETHKNSSLPRSEPAQFSNPRSTALTGDLSVAEIREQRSQMLEQRRERMNEIVQEAQALLSQEDRAGGRRKYLEALKYADDDRAKRELKMLAESLKPAPKR
jgi:hypothetical protein